MQTSDDTEFHLTGLKGTFISKRNEILALNILILHLSNEHSALKGKFHLNFEFCRPFLRLHFARLRQKQIEKLSC